jgi:hypothetical protein
MKTRVGSNQIKSEYRVVSDAIEALYQLLLIRERFTLPELVFVLVSFDHVGSIVVQANHFFVAVRSAKAAESAA